MGTTTTTREGHAMRIGYARVSTSGQDHDPQLDRLTAAGCDRIYTDTASGALASRPEWDRCRDQLRAGDVLVIVRLDRIGRSLRNLLEVVASLEHRGIGLCVLDQQIDTTTPAGKFMFHVLAALSEFERDLIRERTRDGLAAARARGRNGGRRPKLTAAQQATVRRMYRAAGPDGKRAHTVAEIAAAVGVHRTTVYDYLRAA
jgi:DNA invertase Pin-like site-specific DNA recombinase